jgi:hypothetical protein
MRIWEILEKRDEYKPYKEYDREHDDYEFSHRGKMSRKSSEHEYKKMVEDAYECGFKEGYREAMLEAERHTFSERRMK